MKSPFPGFELDIFLQLGIAVILRGPLKLTGSPNGAMAAHRQ